MLLWALYESLVAETVEIPIALLVGGSWVTGMAISPRAWFTQMSASLGGDSSAARAVADLFGILGRAFYQVSLSWRLDTLTRCRAKTYGAFTCETFEATTECSLIRACCAVVSKRCRRGP